MNKVNSQSVLKLALEKATTYFLEIGRSKNLDDPPIQDIAEKLNNLQKSLPRFKMDQYWREIYKPLTAEDLASLLKGYAYCEMKFRWGGGSVSPSVWMSKLLQEKDDEVWKEFDHWLFEKRLLMADLLR
jgi:hypothetical protein